MSKARATKLETEKRVFTIQGWIINGVPDYLILKNIESEWEVKRRQAKNLLKKAYEIWHDNEEATIEEKRSLRIAELKQDIRNMKPEFKNTPKGMSVLLNYKKEINKLEALYPAQKHILQGDKEKPLYVANINEMTPEEQEKRVIELAKKALGQ